MGALEFLGVHRRKDLEKAADDAYVVRRAKEEPRHRPVLGASDLSGGCDRKVWYVWRHAKAESFKGKGSTLRLFGVGHAQEPIFVRDLEAAGCKVSAHRPDGSQWRFSIFGGHFAVNLDGFAVVPPEPVPPDGGSGGEPKRMIVEMKTMNDSNFESLSAKGVRGSHPGYYRQMQAQYMAFKIATGKDIDGFLFVAVNKNTSKYHFEEVALDRDEQTAVWRLLSEVIHRDAPPPPLDISPEAPPCRWCTFRKICRDGRESEVEKSCRSCASAQPVGTGDYRLPGPKEGDPPWQCNRGHEFGTRCADWTFDSRY